ncbi:MAG: efflux RND transporter periplasmic adaptor subunit [Chloroflexota bacterium]
MFKTLRTVLILGAVLICIAAAIKLLNTPNTAKAAGAAATRETATVDQGDVAIAVNATGTIQANQNVPLAFTTVGKVTSISVKTGDHVLKGQTLATIDSQAATNAVMTAQLTAHNQQLALDKLMAKPRQVDIDVAQAQVALAQAQLSEAQSTGPSAIQVKGSQLSVEQAKNQLWQAQLNRDINNQKKANAKGPAVNSFPSNDQNDKSISSADFGVQIAQDQLNSLQSGGAAVGGIASAQASLTSAQASLQTLTDGANVDDIKQAQANVASAQAAVVQAQQAVENSNLVAPFDGLVAQINLSVGQDAPATAAIVLVDVSSFYVDLPIAELDIAKIQVNQPVNLHFQALGTTVVKGKVAQIADTANTGTPVTYTVHIQIDPAGQPLISTMSTTAAIVTSNASNVVRLPNRFIRIDRTKNKAYATVRQPDGAFKEVELKLGTANDTYTEVKSGVKAGDVVTTPTTGGGTGGGAGGGPGGNPLRRLAGG